MRTQLWRIATLISITVSAVWAHYTWVAPAIFEAGKTVKIHVAHGHTFPVSEEAINAAQIKLWAIAPSGARTPLQPVSAGTVVTADFAVKETGPHRIVFTQDRGIMSRTPKGVKAGGRDKNPEATESFSLMRTGVTHAGKTHKPVGLEAELTAERTDAGAWNIQLLRAGKPLAGEMLQVVLAGQKDAVDIGKTGADGKAAYKPAAPKGPAMFLAEFSEKAPAGSSFDSRRFSVTLYVNW